MSIKMFPFYFEYANLLLIKMESSNDLFTGKMTKKEEEEKKTNNT